MSKIESDLEKKTTRQRLMRCLNAAKLLLDNGYITRAKQLQIGRFIMKQAEIERIEFITLAD